MGFIVATMFALLACWRASAAGEQDEVVVSPTLCQASDLTQDTVGTCSNGVLIDRAAEQLSSRKRAGSFIQSQRSALPQSATPGYTAVNIEGKSSGLCVGESIGSQLKDLATADDCADKCQQEPLCAYFSFTVNRCRLFEECTSLKGASVWTSYKLEKGGPQQKCERWCHKKEDPWRSKCQWDACSGCELFCGEPPAAVTRKRGYGHRPGSGFNQCSDATVLGLEDSWYYTWTAFDAPNWKCYREGKRVAAEFVPQVINCHQETADEIWNNIEFYADRWKALGVKFLLGYNEPEGHIHPCTPADGAKAWLMVQKIANYFSPPLRLVSPAPTSKDFIFGDSKWLNEFFESCEALDGCNPDDIEMIAFHDYEGDFDIREDNIQARIAGAAAKYKRKLWLTEFNVGCGRSGLCRDCKHTPYRNGKCKWPRSADDSISAEEHLSVMMKALPFFENNEHIFRYTWFGSRETPNQFAGYSQLLPYDSADQTPTILGEYYRDLEG